MAVRDESGQVDELVNYFRDAAFLTGFGKPSWRRENIGPPEDLYDFNWQTGYSLAWYFNQQFREDAAPGTLLGAFLGWGSLEALPGPDSPLTDAEITNALENYTPHNKYKLNERQREAVKNALKKPLSVIKGPPGTGKTEVIVHIIALALLQGEKVAFVSANNEAVNNVVEKFQQAFANTPEYDADVMRVSAMRMAALGNSANRKTATPVDSKKPFGFEKGKGGWEANISFVDFTKNYPFVTSTVHSLRKCFRDGLEHKFDLIVMDEASQSSVLVGTLALSAARRAVIVGDQEQLAPILSGDIADSLLLRSPDFVRGSHVDLSRIDYSFLDSCVERLGGRNETLLVDHYRCHPKIIEFNNRFVYNQQLKVHRLPHHKDAFPVMYRWYHGDYREGVWLSQNRGTSANSKQLAVFREEEIPYLKRRLQEEPELSVCILAPFHGQINYVKQALDTALKPVVSDGDIEASTVDSDDELSSEVNMLTIHRSQGRGFDIVYLLPVEDGNWEWPWSQGRRLTNVAVSRAKRELRIITSTTLMSQELYREISGHDHPQSILAGDDPQQMFVRLLANYVAGQASLAGNDPHFGFRQSGVRSIFDDIVKTRENKKVVEKSATGRQPQLEESIPQLIVREELAAMAASRGLRLVCQLGLEDICTQEQREQLNGGEHLDFALMDASGKIFMAVEVDGGFHRFNRQEVVRKDEVGKHFAQVSGLPMEGRKSFVIDDEQLHRDRRKDDFVERNFGWKIAHLGRDSYLEERREEFENYSGRDFKTHITSPADVTGCVMLRIPTDGSTFAETNELRNACSELGQLRPTIEDYLDACIQTCKTQPASAVEADLKSSSATLRSLQTLAKDYTAGSLQDELAKRGIVRSESPWDFTKPPTERGNRKGVYLMIGNEDEQWLVFSKRGRDYVKSMIEDAR